MVREHLGRHGLAGPAIAAEQDADAASAAQLLAEAPGFVNLRAVMHLRRDFSKLCQGRGRNHNVIPGETGFNSAPQVPEMDSCMLPACSPQIVAGYGICFGSGSRQSMLRGQLDYTSYGKRAEIKLL